MKRSTEKTIAYSLLAAMIVFAVFLYQKNAILCINLIIGMLFGMIMSRTNFSFTGNLRSPIMSGDYSYTKLFFKLTVITTIGINTIILIAMALNKFDWISYLSKPTEVSLYFFIAAIIFGFGVTLIGAAGSGIMRKAANAKADFVVALIFYLIGSVVGVLLREFALQYMHEGRVFMPEMFGWPLAIGIQAVLLTLVYLFLRKKG